MLTANPTRALPRLVLAVLAVLLPAVLAVFTLLATLATAAQAAVTQTDITAPANHAAIVNEDTTGEPHITVTGTAAGASNGDTVNIICTRPIPAGGISVSTLNPSPIVIAGQAFSYSGSFKNIQGETCVLRAVPTGPTPTDLTPFTGPQLAIDEQTTGNVSPGEENYRVVDGPNNGALYNFYFWGAQFHGALDYLTISSCGVCDSYAVDPTTSAQGGRLFNSNAALFARDVRHVRSDVQVDGNNSYSGYGARRLVERSAPATFDGSQDYANFPSISFASTVDPLTGEVNITEEGSFSHCVGGNPAPGESNHVSRSECTSFAPTGVAYTRHLIQNQDGALVAVIDTFRSTDGAAHALDLLYFQSVLGHGPSAKPGYNFPWISGAFESPAENAVIAPPPGPASIFIKSKIGQADGDETLDQGAITLSTPPAGITFGPGHESTEIELHYLRTIPAGGSVSIGQAFVTAFKLSDVEALTQKAQVALEPPIATPLPLIGTVVTPTPAPSTPAKATGTIAKASYDGKNVLLSIACKAGGATCTGSAEVIARLRAKAPRRNAKHTAKAKRAIAKVKQRFTQITVTKGSFSIPTGQTQMLKLKVGKTAAGLIAKLGKLPTTITLTLSQPDRSSTTTLGHLTLVRHKAKKRKHKH